MDQRFTGYNIARLHARQSREVVGIVLFALLMGVFLSLALANAGLQRYEAWHAAEARV